MSKPKSLTPRQIEILTSQGCFSSDWNRIEIDPDSDLALIRNVEFEGEVKIGRLDRNRFPGCQISNVLISNCTIGNGVRLRNIGGISGLRIGDEARIENCCRIELDKGEGCGIGTRVAVLDETGSREVIIYPGISAQEATIMARARRSDAEKVYARTSEYVGILIDRNSEQSINDIGDRAFLIDCGYIRNVRIDHDVKIFGVSSLVNGTVINSALPAEESLTFVGNGVDAENFIIEDATVDSGTLIRNCYVGQGVRLEKRFTAHDSLFFANSNMENGEACALFAGPYSVSMHKGSLLIGCQTSFMNAGSSTNQSNHMYKLGPVHWGVLERGVKTSSGSYLMLGANIGAFSLLMGNHKTHPDSREFPFSYLFGDPLGATVVVPAVMLRSCGLLRDEHKWPARDRRVILPKEKINDNIIFPILNPVTIEAMITAMDIIRPMLSMPADDDRYIRYKGMKLSRASLERAIKLYYLGILKYLAGIFFPNYQEIGFDEDALSRWQFPTPPEDEVQAERDAEKWIDLGGQIIRFHTLSDALEAATVDECRNILNEAYRTYPYEERRWIKARFPRNLRLDAREILRGAREFDRLVEKDRESYRESISRELGMLRLT